MFVFRKTMRTKFAFGQEQTKIPAENLNWSPSRPPQFCGVPTPVRKQFLETGYPNTSWYRLREEQGVVRRKIFEPALKQFANAYRLTDPEFQTPENEARWRSVQKDVIFHLLQIVQDSAWNDHLVLRGSLLLKAWLGEAAREPGDIDWVVQPSTLSIVAPEAEAMFEEIVGLVQAQPQMGDAVIDVAHITVDDIWTYDRAPGKRIAFPWRVEGLPTGFVQMDIVFGEELWSAPDKTTLSFPGEKTVSLWGVSKEISLAWKLFWLETDMYPQGKDLYDATLLAEQTTLSLKLLKQMFASDAQHSNIQLTPDFPMQWNVDWENFQREYPWVGGSADDWQARLTAALAPMFASGKD